MKRAFLIRFNKELSAEDTRRFSDAWDSLSRMPALGSGETIITIEPIEPFTVMLDTGRDLLVPASRNTQGEGGQDP